MSSPAADSELPSSDNPAKGNNNPETTSGEGTRSTVTPSASVRRSRSRSRATKAVYWNKPPPPIPESLDNRRWHNLQVELARLNQRENQVFFDSHRRPQPPKPITDHKKAFDALAHRYLDYCSILKRLDECYLLIVHPQKRNILKSCICSVLIRILELKAELINVDLREFHFFEDIIANQRLTPDQVELIPPTFIREERAKVLAEREKILNFLHEKHQEEISTALENSKGEQTMTKLQAILLIQRQTRYYLGYMKSEYALRVFRVKSDDWKRAMQWKVVNQWAKYNARNEVKAKRVEVDRFLNMNIKQDRLENKDYTNTFAMDPLVIRNQEKAKENMETYEAERVVLETQMVQQEGPCMAWSLYLTIKQWLLEVRDVLDKFPPFPEEEQGGSLLLFSNMKPSDVADDLDIRFVNNKLEYMKMEKPKKQKKEKKPPLQNPWKDTGFEYIYEETDCMRELKRLTLQYRDYWFYKDDSTNREQEHDREIVREEYRVLITENIRQQVDELIRAELKELTYAIDREPRKEMKPEKKKGKKGGAAKGGRRNKDMTADKTMEELFEELVANNIIKHSPKATLDDFIGEYNFSGASLDHPQSQPLPCLAIVKRMITEFAILPLSSQPIHEAVPLIRKLLIAGLRGTGKKLLLQIICHETGATLFDISPSNLMGKYDNPAGKKMLMHLLIKVGKAMEPSVFWVGECDKMFLKKKDKTDLSKPHQWVKQFHKTIQKGIKNGDRMMLIGTAGQPGLTKVKKFNKFFDRIIIVPYPGYPTRYKAWKHFIEYFIDTPLSPYFDLSSLTKVTAGYTIDSIREVCKRVITEVRKEKAKHYPITPREIVEAIWKLDPIYQEEHDQLLSWYDQTPLARNRALALDGGDDEA